MKADLTRITVSAKTGGECFHSGGEALGYTLLDFWRWSVSDLVTNATRGRLAEFIVAKALGIPTAKVREEWAAYDLISPEGVKVEVKSAAYIQSWTQRGYSAIHFTVAATRAWDPDAGRLVADASRQADVYVFALLSHLEKSSIDPLDLNQWSFYALPAASLDAGSRRSRSISLKVLERVAGAPVGHADLQALITRVAARSSHDIVQRVAPANGSQPSRPDSSRTSAAAGSRR
jgi:hypothetical protein